MGVFLKGWRIKGRLWKAESVTQVTFTAGETEWEQSASAPGHEMAARGGGDRERGEHWDRMDTGGVAASVTPA